MSIQLTRPPKTPDELYYLVKALWGHTIPRHKVCVDHDAPFDAFSEAYFSSEPQLLIHGSRGLAGKSRLLAILGLTKAAVGGGDVNILGGSLNQSMNIHETIRDAWNSPRAPKQLVLDESQTIIRLANGAKIRPLTASQKTVRGPHPPSLLLDEIDEMDEDILNAALGQPMPQKNYLGEVVPAQTTMSSTWQYPDKTFAHVYQRFQENDLPIKTWCYRETSNPHDGWLLPEFVEQKRREIPAEMWRVEYELGEPSIGTRAIDTDAVERMFDRDVEDEHIVKLGKDYEEYKFADYRSEKEYVISADWAREMDFTVVNVWDVTHFPIQLVYYIRMRRRPYPIMIKQYNQLMRKYNAEGVHDATGLGTVVSDYLDHRARGFIMTGERRDNMLSEWVSAVENDRARTPRIKTMYAAHKYVSVDDLYSRSKEFHLPDEVCSAALAWNCVAKRALPVIPEGIEQMNDPYFLDQAMRHNTSTRKSGQWDEAKVYRKTEDSDEPGYSPWELSV